MTDLEKRDGEIINFKWNELMPHQSFWWMIDWNKVFQNKVGVFYPKPINWKDSVDDEWNFDWDKFYLSRNAKLNDRKVYTETRNRIILTLERYVTKWVIDDFYLEENLEKLLESYKKLYFLWKRLVHDPYSEIYTTENYLKIEQLLEQIKWMNRLPENAWEYQSIAKEIIDNIQQTRLRESKKWEEYEAELLWHKKTGVSNYLDDNGKLNVESVLDTLNWRASWNEETMLIALFDWEVSKEELVKLQEWVIEALDNKVLRLDTHKVFIILQWVFPFVFESYDMKFDIPEIFQPEYLSKLTIYDLSLEKFTAQVLSRWEENNWSKEVQEKLIGQFKKFWTTKEWNIAFWQWSEQLWYWSWVTWWINKENYTHYLIDRSLLVDTLPTPNILQTYDEWAVNQYSQNIWKVIWAHRKEYEDKVNEQLLSRDIEDGEKYFGKKVFEKLVNWAMRKDWISEKDTDLLNQVYEHSRITYTWGLSQELANSEIFKLHLLVFLWWVWWYYWASWRTKEKDHVVEELLKEWLGEQYSVDFAARILCSDWFKNIEEQWIYWDAEGFKNAILNSFSDIEYILNVDPAYTINHAEHHITDDWKWSKKHLIDNWWVDFAIQWLNE